MGAAITKKEFLKRAKKVHGNRYDYSKLDYHKITEKGVIICKVHGEFVQKLISHVYSAVGCPECGGSVKRTRETFEIAARKIHGDKYDYSEFIYENNKIKSILICRDCGNKFEIRPDAHINGKGCSICGYKKAAKKRAKSLETFINESRKIHGNRYDYSQSIYINSETKLKIICKKHNIFEQAPSNHLSGVGCPECVSSKGENEISCVLNNMNIKYIPEKIFDDCKNPLTGRYLYFDFYLPDKNICIEYDGKQHFFPIDFYGGVDNLNDTKNRDLIKTKYCIDNNISIIRISYLDHDRIEYILKSIL